MSSAKPMMWIVVADTNACVIYAHKQYSQELTFLKRFNHPENKLRDIELTSDKPGHYGTSTCARGAYSQTTDPKENKIDQLALEIAKELEHGRTTLAYEKLIVIALPHMNGLIKHHLNKHVKELMTLNLEKNLMHLTPGELLEQIKMLK